MDYQEAQEEPEGRPGEQGELNTVRGEVPSSSFTIFYHSLVLLAFLLDYQRGSRKRRESRGVCGRGRAPPHPLRSIETSQTGL